MFLKVFKYDFKSIFFKFIPLLAIIPVLSIVVRLINLIQTDNSFLILVIGGFNALFVFGCVFLILYTIIICIVRYVKSLFRDQGYLTHTLPVSKHQLLLSQILADVLMCLLAIVVAGLCIVTAYFTGDTIKGIQQFIAEIFEIAVTDSEIMGTLVLVFFTLIFGSLQSLFVVYTGVALGHAHPKNKTILSVVYCIGLNYGLGIIFAIFNTVAGIVLEQNAALGNINIFLAIMMVESICVSVGGYFLVIYLMKNRLNLE